MDQEYIASLQPSQMEIELESASLAPSESKKEEIEVFERKMRATLKEWGNMDPRDGTRPKSDVIHNCWDLVSKEIRDIATRNNLSKTKVTRFLLHTGVDLLWKTFGEETREFKNIQSYIHNTSLAKQHENWFSHAHYTPEIMQSEGDSLHVRVWEIDIEKAGGFASSWGLMQPLGRQLGLMMALIHDNKIMHRNRIKMIEALTEFRRWLTDHLGEAQHKKEIVWKRVGTPECELLPTPIDLIFED